MSEATLPWNLLHDAATCDGSTLVLTFEGSVGRAAFTPAGRGFRLVLHGVRRFEYQPWDERVHEGGHMAAGQPCAYLGEQICDAAR